MDNQQNTMQMRKICQYTVDQYIDKLTKFHGNLAPGLLVGGFMVDAAVKEVTQYEFFDVICETSSCLPDVIQLLTPCTVGNGWLKIVNTGRFAITLYDKKSGNGVRVSMDAAKLEQYPEIKNWFMRRVSKHEQDKDALINEIRAAEHKIFSMQPVTVSPALRSKLPGARIVLCGSCGEPYPENNSTLCPACQGMDIYV